MTYVWGAVSGVLIIASEIGFRLSPSYRAIIWWAWPLAIAVNYTVWHLVRAAPSLPAAFIVLSLATMLARIVASLWIGDAIGYGTYAGAALIIVAAVLQRLWA